MLRNVSLYKGGYYYKIIYILDIIFEKLYIEIERVKLSLKIIVEANDRLIRSLLLEVSSSLYKFLQHEEEE